MIENEKNILDASEYILMTINNIKTFEQFIDYRGEIIKAIYDIRDSVINLIKIKKRNKKNFAKNDFEFKEKSKSSISSMLGLKYNYDEFLNDFYINNTNPNENENNIMDYKFQEIYMKMILIIIILTMKIIMGNILMIKKII